MDEEKFYRQFFPVHEYHVFMEVQGDRVLIAHYSSNRRPPDVGGRLIIESFKERPEFPDEVKVLDVREQSENDTIVFQITVEPA